MAVITQTIQPGEQRTEVTEIQKALISLGDKIASDELSTATTEGIYGTTTQLAVAALMDRFGIKHFNMPIPFNASLGRLLNIAVGAESGNSAALLSGRGICPPDWAGVHESELEAGEPM